MNTMKKSFLSFCFVLGLCFSLLWGCSGNVSNVNSFEQATQVLQNDVLPKISVTNNVVSDQVAQNYSVKNIVDPLPPIDKYPLYGASPTNDPNISYIEIFTSPDKGNAEKEDERWLVDVAEKFNAQNLKTESGKKIQVGIRNLPSGISQRMIAEKVAKPAAYTPSNQLWIAMLKSAGIESKEITPELVPNQPGILLNQKAKQENFGSEEVTFDKLLDAIVAGKIAVGYTNPYTSSSGLNLLYTIFWRAAGHQTDGKPLTVSDLESPQVNSLFKQFQKQVLVTGLTTLELKDVAVRNPEKLPAFVTENFSYVSLKKSPEFAQSTFIPFGLTHNSPLVAFKWTTPEQEQGLEKFAKFAQSSAMQKLAPPLGKEVIDYLQKKQVPPIPKGDVLTTAQTFWKQQKDAGQTVYLMTVIDTSGSMEGTPLNAVKEGLRIASAEINAGNHVGLVSYGDQPIDLVPLAPFDQMQHKRFLAAVDSLQANGSTAMYDGVMVGLSKLMEQKKANPNGKFYLLLLTDGQTNRGFNFDQIKNIIEYSGVRVYPIAYGDVNQDELNAIAALRESTVKTGNPENVRELLKGLFQVNL